jgi:hypothetical protein
MSALLAQNTSILDYIGLKIDCIQAIENMLNSTNCQQVVSLKIGNSIMHKVLLVD